MAAAGSIDPTKPAKYPIILSDALLGKTSKETFTGIRYNHRPALSSDIAPNTARLKKSAKDGSYNIGFDDHGDKYLYNGTRTTEDGNYVLIFDPARKAFVLHRVDSMFHMNITRTPQDGNAESLRKQFPQLEIKDASGRSTAKQQQKGKEEKAAPGKATAGPAKGKGKARETKAPVAKETSIIAKGGKKTKANEKAQEKAKAIELTLPMARKPSPPPPPPAAPAPEEKKSKRRARSPVESEEEDNDDIDIGLTIEYPGGHPSTIQPRSFPPSSFNPTFPPTRRFSEFVRSAEREEEDEDADAEFDDMIGELEDEEEEEEQHQRNPGFKLPSPVGRLGVIEPPARFEFETDMDGDADADGEIFEDVDVDVPDLEAELEREFLKVGNEVPMEDPGQDSDSSMSEEE